MRSMTAIVTGGVLVAGLAVPALAEDAGGTAQCVDDPSGDVRQKTGSSPSASDPAASEPKADITRYCVSSGPEASFHVSVARPTDPLDDDGWQGATFIGWYVDTADDAYFIDFSLDASGSDQSSVTAEVKEGTGDNTVLCQLPVQLTEGGYAISGVEPSCFGGDEVIQAEVAMYYDRGSQVVYDIADGMDPQDISAADRTTRRLEGLDRTRTSVAISQEQFAPGDADTVYLSRDDVFADAAVGGVLTDGPILVVPSCGTVPTSVAAEINRLDVDTVTALGGTTAICDQMLTSAADGRNQDRLGGADRFATSVAIAKEAFASPDRVYLARSDEFIDAVAGGTLTDGPILLVPQCGDVPQVVADAIDDFDPNEVVGLGGTVAICEPTLEQAADGRPTSRLAGDDRYGTAIEIAHHVFPEPTASAVYLARADLVVDALAGGVLTDGPVLVVDSCGDFTTDRLQPVATEITRNAPDEVVALGGPQAICDATLEQAGGF